MDIIGNIPWGTHFCQFYQTKEDLIDILFPYFKSGLENNEVCIWITSQPLEVEEAKEALRRTVPELDTYLKNGQIEFIPYAKWNLQDSNFDSKSISNVWVEKLDQALTNGYEGLRLARNTFWLGKKVWNDFADYEEEIAKIIGNYPMMFLWTYFLDGYNTNKIIDLIINHQFALIKREGKWEHIENYKHKKREDKIQILANIVESSDDAIITKSLDGIITSWNKGAEQVYGYSAKEILGKPISILEPYILVEETKELVELIKQKDRIHHHETLRLRKDGKIINVSLTLSPILDVSENLIAVLVIARDITKSKKAEEKLKKSRERYKIVTEQIGQMVYDYDSRTGECIWEGAIEEVTGYSFEELQKFGKDFWVNNIHCEDKNHVNEIFQNVKTTEGRFKEELRLKRKDGTYIYIENKGLSLKDHEGQFYGAIGILKDITSTKVAEIQLQESERKYRSFIQNFHGIAFQTDKNFVPIFLHGAVEEITGYNEKDLISVLKWKEITHPDDLPFVPKEYEHIQNYPSAGYGEIEFRIKHKDGRTKWLNEIYQRVSGNNGKPEFFQGAIYDVTEKKETEKFLKNIETARKKEIHHRIKNNLQVISSLLDLQAEKFKNKMGLTISEIIDAFRESQDRVISMALIHEELYKGGELDTLNFSSYIKELVENLFLTYKLGNTNTILNMNLEENVFLDMDTAIPLGIIINELVSNSLKHAFIGRDKGEIQIKLRREESNNKDLKGTSFILTVSDDGIGIPENLDLRNSSNLGTQLITTLVDQLEGELKMKVTNGTEFTIRFPVTGK